MRDQKRAISFAGTRCTVSTSSVLTVQPTTSPIFRNTFLTVWNFCAYNPHYFEIIQVTVLLRFCEPLNQLLAFFFHDFFLGVSCSCFCFMSLFSELNIDSLFFISLTSSRRYNSAIGDNREIIRHFTVPLRSGHFWQQQLWQKINSKSIGVSLRMHEHRVSTLTKRRRDT